MAVPTKKAVIPTQMVGLITGLLGCPIICIVCGTTGTVFMRKISNVQIMQKIKMLLLMYTLHRMSRMRWTMSSYQQSVDAQNDVHQGYQGF
jgi:adenine C2-methylase RlmN of 23S rRNA A2503 and tRNA A37